MRTRETNCSMPSGDAAQASLMTMFVIINYQNCYKILGGPLGISQFVMLVCFSRVWFHCHYLGDTMVGTFLGSFVASMLSRLGTKEFAKVVFKAMGFGKQGEDGLFGDM